MIRSLVLGAALAVFAAGAAPNAANAHAFLDHADPKVGATVAKAPPTLRLWFTQALVTAFSHVTVTGPAGFGGASPAHPVAGDPHELAVDLRGPTPPGVYHVAWRVLSVDTHTTEGTFSFRVGP